MSSQLGKFLSLQIFGESHGPYVGFILDGFPAGIALEKTPIVNYLNKRRGGQHGTTPRRESDQPIWISGTQDGHTNGEPLTALFENNNIRSEDYREFDHILRPSHGDYPRRLKYGAFATISGGGHYSGRLTLPLTAAGALCDVLLKKYGISHFAHLEQMGPVTDRRPDNPVQDPSTDPSFALPVFDRHCADQMHAYLERLTKEKDSIGACAYLCYRNVPIGLGAPFFDTLDGALSRALFAIPGVRAVGIGDAWAMSEKKGSQANDPYHIENGKIRCVSNHAGGVNGGLSNGEDLILRVVFRPTPTIGHAQNSVDILKKQNTVLHAQGRHDPCIGVRGLIAAVSVCNLVIADFLQGGCHEFG